FVLIFGDDDAWLPERQLDLPCDGRRGRLTAVRYRDQVVDQGLFQGVVRSRLGDLVPRHSGFVRLLPGDAVLCGGRLPAPLGQRRALLGSPLCDGRQRGAPPLELGQDLSTLRVELTCKGGVVVEDLLDRWPGQDLTEVGEQLTPGLEGLGVEAQSVGLPLEVPQLLGALHVRPRRFSEPPRFQALQRPSVQVTLPGQPPVALDQRGQVEGERLAHAVDRLSCLALLRYGVVENLLEAVAPCVEGSDVRIRRQRRLGVKVSRQVTGPVTREVGHGRPPRLQVCAAVPQRLRGRR